MKKIVAWLAVCLTLFFLCIEGSAAEAFYTAYTPKSANSSVFYIDVFCDREITAAVFELSFDNDMVSYYSVSAENRSSSVRDRAQSGKVTFAFADSSPVSGKLCRVSFKALHAGSVSFTLHTEQSADADRKKLPSFDDHTLIVKLGKEDVVSEGAVTHSDSKDSSKGSKSSIRSSSNQDDTDDSSHFGGVFDLRREDPHRWILIGAGGVVLIAALVGLGVLLGRRMKARKLPEKADDPTSSEPQDEPDDM